MSGALWRGEPLVLASASRARSAVLEAAGIPVERRPADIDERAVERPLLAAGEPAAAIAAHLAAEKALAVSRAMPGRLVLGADQVLDFGGERFNKPADRAAARAQLRLLSGRRHALHSAAALAENGAVVETAAQTAVLTMRPLGDAFLDRYLDAVGEAVTQSVGAYQIEGLGAQLFEAIDGDHFTVLGLPLLPLLAILRQRGRLSA
ncbi:MAG TPA: Maf family protein [Hyphomicrobiales bacterium]|nr:Maf family protein [Hyphomicrobiales bacterium]